MTKHSKGKACSKPAIAAASKASEDSRASVIGISFALAAAVWLVFGQTLRHEFINYDDNAYVYGNPVVTKGLTWDGVMWAFTKVHASNWHPLTWLTHMLDCQIYDLRPAGHHATNVLLHAATAVLLFLVVRRMTGVLWPSALIAAVFALHPLRVESVAWVAERKDVLSGLFFVLTIGAYTRYAERPSVSRYLAVAGCLVLGLMSKPMLVTLPFVLVLLDYWPLKRISGQSVDTRNATPGRLLLEKVPLFALAFGACVITVLAQEKAMKTLEYLPVSARVSNAVVSYVAYLGQTVYPAKLLLPYLVPKGGYPAWCIALSLALLAAISIAVFLLRFRRPYLLVGWLWYLGMLVPVIGLVQVSAHARADRYTYLPHIGLYLAIGSLVASWCAVHRRRAIACASAAAVMVMVLAGGAWLQTRHWQTSETLWRYVLAVDPNNFMGHLNLGTKLYELNRKQEAAAELERAREIDPNYFGTYNYLALILAEEGRTDEAAASFQKALALWPDYADAHGNYARLLAFQGRTSEAIPHFQKAIQIDPHQFLFHHYLGAAFVESGQLDEAVLSFQRALELKPADAEAHSELGAVLLELGRGNEAVSHFEKAVAINPRLAEAQCNLGIALLQSGQLSEAISHLQLAIENRPHYPQASFHLGVALTHGDRLREAIARFEQALQDDKDLSPPQLLSVCNAMAWILATCREQPLRNGARAVELAERANQLANGGNPMVLDTLAAAYAEAGDFGRAVSTAQQAIERAKATGHASLAADVQQRLTLYQNGQAFHEAPSTPRL